MITEVLARQVLDLVIELRAETEARNAALEELIRRFDRLIAKIDNKEQPQ
jgi:hypothetical protein